MPSASINRTNAKSTSLIPISKLPWTVVAIIALGLHVTVSASDRQSETPPIAYYPSSECPSRSAFIAEIDRRAQGAMELANPDLPPYVVEVGQNDHGAFAIFQYRDASGNQVERTFKAASCEEVASAVALVIALALQGGQALEPEPRVLEQEEQKTNESSDTQRELADRANEPTDDRLSRAAEEEAYGFDWQIGASVVLDSLPVPGMLIKGGVFGGVAWNEFGSGVQAGFIFGESGIVEQNERSASFLLLGGRVDLCPLHVLRISGIVVHPCLAAEMGSIRSRGMDSDRFLSETHEKFWSAGGPLLRIRAAVYDLLVEIHGGAWFPLVRSTKKYVYSELEGEISFYEIPNIGGTMGANIGYRF